MQVENEFALERPRVRTMLLLAAVLAVLMVGVAGSTSLTTKAEACSGGAICSFGGSHWGSFIGNYTCGVAFGVNLPETWSVKNNCGNNVRLAWKEGPITNWKFCMSPGGERPTPGRVNYAGPC